MNKEMKYKEFIDYIVKDQCKIIISEFVEDWENQKIKISNYIQANFYDKNLDDAIMDDELFEEGKKKWEEKLK